MNVKNKLRKIVVNNIQYVWSISKPNCDGDGSSILKIWKNKKLLYEKLISGCLNITPKIISDIIQFENPL